MAATIFPAPSASQLTDQGGQVVLARFKSGDVAIPLTALSAGTYFVTAQGSGILTASTYANGNLGPQILSFVVSGSTTAQIVVPSGVTGLVLTGTYNGPIVFQTLQSASNVLFGAVQVQLDTSFPDFTSETWAAITNSPFYITWNSGYSTIVNFDTGVAVTTDAGSNRPIYASNQGYLNGRPEWLYAYNPSTGTICFTNGYSGQYNSTIYRSTNQGLTWSPISSVTGNYYYWDSTQFEGANFYVTAGWTGQSSGVQLFYVSANDGVTWTARSISTTVSQEGVRKIVYSPQLNKYVAFTLLHDSQGASPPYTQTLAVLTADGTDIAQTINFYPPSSVGFVNAEWLRPSNGNPGRFVLVEQNGAISSSQDGISWSQWIGSGWASYSYLWRYGKYGFVHSYRNEPINPATTTGAVMFTRYDGNSYRYNMVVPSDGNVYGQMFSNPPFTFYGAAESFTQLSNEPVTGLTRATVFRSGTDYGHRYIKELSTTLYSPSGWSGNFNTNSNGNAYFSEKFQKAYIVTQDQSIYRSENATKLLPSILVGGTGVGKTHWIETKSGTLLLLDASNYVWRTTDGINFTTTYVPINSYLGSGHGQIATYNDIIVITSGAQTGTNRYLYVSVDQGASFFRLDHPNTGTSTEYLRVYSTGASLISKGSGSGKIFTSTDGLTWTDTSRTWNFNPFYKTGDGYFSNFTASAQQAFFPPNASIELTFNSPNQSYSWYPAKFGSGYALFYIAGHSSDTQLNYFYTSENGVSWTQRSILPYIRWTGGFGGNSFGIAYSNYEKTAQKVIATRTVTVQ